MTTEELATEAPPPGIDEGEEQVKSTKREEKKKEKKSAGNQVEESDAFGTDRKNKKKKSKKRVASELDSGKESHVDAEVTQEVGGEYDENEPTMAEKLASLGLVDEENTQNIAKDDPSPIPAPPSADSVHLLLKQALHADDHALLLDCLYTRDEKVIAKSTSLLNPADVLKLLKSLTSIIQQRGAVVVCALPWLRSLITQHASSIASQESSLLILNSLYQLIESRISTFRSALQLSTCLDVMFAKIPEHESEDEEESAAPAIIYEDKDTDEEDDDDEDVMETDDDNENLGDVIDSHNSDGSEVMSD